jgi:hypothetical protein
MLNAIPDSTSKGASRVDGRIPNRGEAGFWLGKRYFEYVLFRSIVGESSDNVLYSNLR